MAIDSVEQYGAIRVRLIAFHDEIQNPTYATIKEHLERFGWRLNNEEIRQVMTQLVQAGAVNNAWYLEAAEHS